MTNRPIVGRMVRWPERAILGVLPVLPLVLVHRRQVRPTLADLGGQVGAAEGLQRGSDG
jgi:hypothetical protein